MLKNIKLSGHSSVKVKKLVLQTNLLVNSGLIGVSFIVTKYQFKLCLLNTNKTHSQAFITNKFVSVMNLILNGLQPSWQGL